MAGANALAGLFGRRRFAIRPGTERIEALLTRLGHPERDFQAIHVVGTNGKGSTAAFLSAILTAAGYRTGLFTSPHLISYAERFRVDGVDMAEDALDRLLTRILAIAAPDDTFFELTTALACCWFAERRVELAVLEAGMGGQADATAAIPAGATIITPVALDHSQWLGTSIAAIAAEKASIAEAGTPMICAPQAEDALAVIRHQGAYRQNRLWLAGHDFLAAWEPDGRLAYQGPGITLQGLRPGIPGRYQLWNGACALAMAELLAGNGLSINAAAMAEGIAVARWPGRMERFPLPGDVELLLDGAHNPAGAAALADSLQDDLSHRAIILVLGVMADKELEGLLPPLLQLAREVITVTPAQDRALTAEQLARGCASLGVTATAAGAVAAGVARARQIARPGDLIVVAGSLFTVAEARSLLTGQTCTAVRG